MQSRGPWGIYAALLFGTFVTIEAAAFQAPVLPSLARHFGIPVSLAALILVLYFLALTVFAPIMGRLGDQYGRRKVLTAGMVLFAASEFVAAWAPSFGVFLAARFAQGLGVACILPGVYAYVTHLFPADRRGLALGILTFTMTLGAASGGLLGALLIETLGWPSVYWISGILALLGLLPVRLLVPEIAATRAPAPFDYTGAMLLMLTIGALLSLPGWATTLGWSSPLTLATVVTGFVSLALLWRHSRRAKDPVIDTSILTRPAFALPSAIYWLHMLFFSGVLYSLAFFINHRPGGSAAQFGFVTLFLYGSGMVSAPFAGRLIDRFNARTVSSVALSGTLLGSLLLLQIDVHSPLWMVIAVVCIFGLMVGANTPAVMKVAFGAVPPERMGAGTGLFSMIRDLGNPTGSALSLALFGATLAYQTRASLRRQLESLGLDGASFEALAQAAGGRVRELPAALLDRLTHDGIEVEGLLRLANVEGLDSALDKVGYLLTAMILVALLLSLRLPRTQPAPVARAET